MHDSGLSAQAQHQQHQPPAVQQPAPPPEQPPMCGDNRMNIVFVGAECAPWSKTGTPCTCQPQTSNAHDSPGRLAMPAVLSCQSSACGAGAAGHPHKTGCQAGSTSPHTLQPSLTASAAHSCWAACPHRTWGHWHEHRAGVAGRWLGGCDGSLAKGPGTARPPRHGGGAPLCTLCRGLGDGRAPALPGLQL